MGYFMEFYKFNCFTYICVGLSLSLLQQDKQEVPKRKKHKDKQSKVSSALKHPKNHNGVITNYKSAFKVPRTNHRNESEWKFN